MKIILFMTLGLIFLLYGILPSGYFEAEARCPNGYHKDESGECEKVTDNKGKPRCDDGYHRSPDGDCEKVNDGSSSSKGNNDDDDDDDDDGDKKKPSTKNSDDELENSNKCQGVADCFEGRVTEVVDGDTIDINNVRIRLSLINTPEIGQAGYEQAKEFVESVCGVGSWARVDEDDGQRGGSFDRMIGFVYCKNSDTSLNEKIIQAGHAEILQEFCDISEFSAVSWATSSCQIPNDENENNFPEKLDKDPGTLSKKQEQQAVPLESEFSQSNEAQSYSNSKLGISLKHPTDWKVENLKNGIQLIKEKNGVYVEIRKHDIESPDMQLKQYVGDYIKDRTTSREDFKLLDITETTISGNLPAYKALYTFLKTENQNDFTTGGTTNKILRIWTFTEDNAYLIAYVADEDKYDSYLPFAQKIIDSVAMTQRVR